MTEPAGDGGGGAAAAEMEGGEIVAHLAGFVASDLGVALAELTHGVLPPALHRVVVEQGAGVAGPTDHGARRATGSEVDWR